MKERHPILRARDLPPERFLRSNRAHPTSLGSHFLVRYARLYSGEIQATWELDVDRGIVIGIGI